MFNSLDDLTKCNKENVDAAMKSLGVISNGVQAIAAGAADYSKKSFEQGTEALEKLLGARSLEKAMEVQSDYIRTAYEFVHRRVESRQRAVRRRRQGSLQAVRDLCRQDAGIALRTGEQLIGKSGRPRSDAGRFRLDRSSAANGSAHRRNPKAFLARRAFCLIGLVGALGWRMSGSFAVIRFAEIAKIGIKQTPAGDVAWVLPPNPELTSLPADVAVGHDVRGRRGPPPRPALLGDG